MSANAIFFSAEMCTRKQCAALTMVTENDCTSECKERGLLQDNLSGIFVFNFSIHKLGCGKLWVTDGIWILNFSHCMYQVKVSCITTIDIHTQVITYSMSILIIITALILSKDFPQ